MASRASLAVLAAKQLLEGLSGTPEHAACSRAQAEKLVSMMRDVVMTGLEGTEITRVVCSSNWHDSADLDLVLCSIFQSTSPAPSAKGSGQGRAGMQDYTALHHFLPASLWDVLVDAQTSMEPKLTLLQRHAGNLGLAWPSEKTSLHVTALLLLCQRGASQALAMRHDNFLDLLKWVKKQLRVLNPQQDPKHLLLVLPETPVRLQEECPMLFSEVFSTAPPVTPPIHVPDLLAIVGHFPVRSSKRLQAATQLLAGSGLGSGLGQVAAAVTQQLQQMQQQQASMMQMLSGQDPVSTTWQPVQGGPAGRQFPSFTRRPSISWVGDEVNGAPSADVPITSVATGSDAIVQLCPPKTGWSLAVQQSQQHQRPLQLQPPSLQQPQQQQQEKQQQEMPQQKLPEPAKQPMEVVGTVSDHAGVALAALEAREVRKKPAAATCKGPVPKGGKRPHFALERTRGQVMCRTGKAGVGQSHAIRFSDAGTEQKAIKLAKEWVAEQLQHLRDD